MPSLAPLLLELLPCGFIPVYLPISDLPGTMQLFLHDHFLVFAIGLTLVVLPSLLPTPPSPRL